MPNGGPAADRLDPHAGLVAALVEPRRPRLAEACAAVDGLTDPRQAWETLATQIGRAHV
jgi:hypothetical protein